MQHSVLFLIKKQARTLLTKVTDNFLMIVNPYCLMTCCGFCLASEFSQQEASQGCAGRHSRCSRCTCTRFAWSPVDQLSSIPVTHQNPGSSMGSVYLSSLSQSSFWKTLRVCLFSWVWLDIAVTVTHIFLLMIPQCLWGNECNCSTLCCGQCIENASTAERGRVTFHNFCFYTSHAFCHNDDSSGFTVA